MFVCPNCGAEFQTSELKWRCPECGEESMKVMVFTKGDFGSRVTQFVYGDEEDIDGVISSLRKEGYRKTKTKWC